MKIIIPISVGEILDKISILQIKSQHTNSPYVTQELQDLIQIAKENQVYDEEELKRLFEVNSKLWKIEDELRIAENKFVFNDDFIRNARLVYITNDQRAAIKKEINEKYNSQYQEVKCYGMNSY
jgi:hypothetical protein